MVRVRKDLASVRPPGEARGVAARIESALGERFGYRAWIVLATCDELRAALGAFPFDRSDATRQPYAVFCADDAVRDAAWALAEPLASAVDLVAAGPGNVVFWSPPRGESLTTPFARELARARWKAVTTTRNLRTVAKIIA